MRISDWSSDVCSSDLVDALPAGGRGPVGLPRARRRRRPGQPVRGSGTTGLTLQERLQPRAFASTPQVRGKDAGWQSLPFLPGASTQRWSGKKLEAAAAPTRAGERTDERRVGNEWVRTCRSRGSPYHKTKKQKERCVE